MKVLSLSLFLFGWIVVSSRSFAFSFPFVDRNFGRFSFHSVTHGIDWLKSEGNTNGFTAFSVWQGKVLVLHFKKN